MSRHNIALEVSTRTPSPPDVYSIRPLDHLLHRAYSTVAGPNPPDLSDRPSPTEAAASPAERRCVSFVMTSGNVKPNRKLEEWGDEQDMWINHWIHLRVNYQTETAYGERVLEFFEAHPPE